MSEHPPEMLLPPPGNAGRLLRQFIRFFGVGALVTVAHYFVMIALVEFAGVESVRAALAGYLVGGVLSYLFNRHFTFASTRAHRGAVWRFAVVAGVGFGLTYAFMALFARSLGWHYLLSQVLTTGIVLFWSFFAHKFWSFGEKS